MRHILLIIALLSLCWTGPRSVLGESPESATELEPGANYIGWIGDPISPSELFRSVPAAQVVYAWDAQAGHFRFAAPRLRGSLDLIAPGMAVLIRIGGTESVVLQQQVAADGESLRLARGFNLVTWTGPSGTPLNLALRSVGANLLRAYHYRAPAETFFNYNPRSAADRRSAPQINRGDALWVRVAEDTTWVQPSGERPLYELGPPPATLGVDPFYQKYLNADGIEIVASNHVADEALFRSAAIFDDVLAGSAWIRELFVRFGVYTVIVGKDERGRDLPEFRNNRLQEFADYRGLGPSGNSPLLIPEENILCAYGDVRDDDDIVVHEFAHAIDYVVSRAEDGVEFQSILALAYEREASTGDWRGTYASTNQAEYWAEGIQSWFGLNGPPKGGIQNQVDTREELESHAPILASLIRRTIGNVSLSASCHEVRSTINDIPAAAVHGKLDLPESDETIDFSVGYHPLERSGIILAASTIADGSHHAYLPFGTYEVGLNVTYPGCNFDGWVGKDGVVTGRQLAHRFVVGEDITGLTDAVQSPEGLCEQKIIGRLLDSDGAPVPDVSFTARERANVRNVGFTTTDAQGRYSLTVPVAGSYLVRADFGNCVAYYSEGGFVLHSLSADRVNVRDDRDVVIGDLLRRGICDQKITGRVVDANGDPLIRIFAIAESRTGRRGATLTGTQGNFTIDVPEAGSYRVHTARGQCNSYYSANGMVNEESQASWVVVDLPGRTPELLLRMQDGMCDRWIKGRLLNSDGTGAHGRRLSAVSDAWSNGTTTQAEGSISFAVPQPGRYRLSVAIDRCTIYYDRSGAGTTDPARATMVDLTNDSFEGLEFRLPEDPANACR